MKLLPDEDIWRDDLFGRKNEASLLIGYIESVSTRRTVREDSKSYVIAIDAGYGVGKTFFLRRLNKELATNHPVAFVDAWSDDLSDEPLTALAATLKAALGELISTNKNIKARWRTFVEKSGKVAGIATRGLLTRAAGMAIGMKSAEAIGDVIGEVSDDVSEAVREAAQDAATEVVAKGSKAVAGKKLMEMRIADFEAGQTAIREMKASLSALISALPADSMYAPIVIIIDELDRCRPTYAVKLFEEIKHLFDVPGLVFVLGMHGEQLAHSVSGAYGPAFDGRSYLNRFINRRLTLASPSVLPLVKSLLPRLGLNSDQAYFPLIHTDNAASLIGYSGTPHEVLIARYMDVYELPARAAFELLDMLQTCVALTDPRKVHLAYLLPIIISHIKGAEFGTVLEPKHDFGFEFNAAGYTQRRVKPLRLLSDFRELATLDQQRLISRFNEDDEPIYPAFAAMEAFGGTVPPDSLALIANYPRLVLQVGRFRDPELVAESVGVARGTSSARGVSVSVARGTN